MHPPDPPIEGGAEHAEKHANYKCIRRSGLKRLTLRTPTGVARGSDLQIRGRDEEQRTSYAAILRQKKCRPSQADTKIKEKDFY